MIQLQDQNVRHTTELTEITRQYREDCSKRDKDHTTEIHTLKADFNERISMLNHQLADKDTKIAEMNTEHTKMQV